MIRGAIHCDWPGCLGFGLEEKEGDGWPGWGHVRGWKVDGQTRDFHLCPAHLTLLMEHMREIKQNDLDRS
jgi:hypothetical protein